MVDKTFSFDQSLSRLEKALNLLEKTVENHLDNQKKSWEIEEEVQRLNADRSLIAQELDHSTARGEKLDQANKEVSRRLITAMETIRAVLDQ